MCSREKEWKADRDHEKEREGDYFGSGREGELTSHREKKRDICFPPLKLLI